MSTQGSHLSAAVLSNSSIKNLSVELFKSEGNVFSMDSYVAELWLTLFELLQVFVQIYFKAVAELLVMHRGVGCLRHSTDIG